MRTCLFYLPILLFCWACHRAAPLEQALEAAGENRAELEKVIAHYSQSPEDSLSLKAALFLIENMPGHYTSEGRDFRRYREGLDSLHPTMSHVVKSVLYTLPLRTNLGIYEEGRVEDVENIRADYLIAHIDRKMALWRSCPWLSNHSFEEFCEYLLPYRVTAEPLLPSDTTADLWREMAAMMDGAQFTPTTLADVRLLLREKVGKEDDGYLSDVLLSANPPMRYTLDCLSTCLYDVLSFRAAGIPSAIDFVPYWAHRNGSHSWTTLIEPTSANRSFSEVNNIRSAKVYRMTYSRNERPSPGTDKIPELFQDPFFKDVSALYMPVTDLQTADGGHPEKTIYLSVFNNLGWQPIAWGNPDDGKVLFRDMGRNVVYLPTYYVGNEKCHFGYPLWLHTDGTVEELCPDTLQTVTLHLTRKYPLTGTKLMWGMDLRGCRVEASSRRDFHTADTLAQVDRVNPALGWTELELSAPGAYRYWRISKRGGFVPLAEVRFYNQSELLTGVPFQAEGVPSGQAFDGDVLTFEYYPSWIGLDFGHDVPVTRIRLLPRTDDNGINAGEVYELYYYGAEGWLSLGTQVATSAELEFPKVPAHALYWLRNLQRGQEERIFVWRDGRVIFL